MRGLLFCEMVLVHGIDLILLLLQGPTLPADLVFQDGKVSMVCSNQQIYLPTPSQNSFRN